MANASKINGVGLGIAVTGVILGYAGFRNIPLLEAFKALAMGKSPTPHPKAPYDPVQVAQSEAEKSLDSATAAASIGDGSVIVTQAMKHQGKHPYVYGGGHSSFCTVAQDCSGFVSCVLHELGLLNSTLNTTGFLAWKGAVTVPFEQRQPGDLIIWASHMGIVVNSTQMIHTGGEKGCPCVRPYTRLRRGMVGTIRRVKVGGGVGKGPAKKTAVPPCKNSAEVLTLKPLGKCK